MWSPVESAGGGGGGGTGAAAGAAPCARCKHSATLLGGHVYVLGGRGAGGCVPLRDFWRYHLRTGVWERLSTRGDAPPALQQHTASAHGQKLYVFGGEAGALSAEVPLWIYDSETAVWRKLSTPAAGGAGSLRRKGRGPSPPLGPGGRRGHSAHALNDCLLIYGGYKDLRGSTNELWAFHYESELWHLVRTGAGRAGGAAGAAGPARHRHAAAMHDDRLYVHGGQCDLRDCSDLWFYDTLSRSWTQVRTPAKLSPGARSGHSGLRAGAHFYVFGGEVGGHPTNELWRFHFATETWERVAASLQWPSPRADAAALLVAGAPPLATRLPPPPPAPAPPRPEPPATLMREISKLSSFRLRRAARCAYSVLGERDSTESLPRAVPKSQSFALELRQPHPTNGGAQPKRDAASLAHDPLSVPEFAAPATPLSTADAARLVYFDSEEEEELRRDVRSRRAGAASAAAAQCDATGRVALRKSASVRFSRDVTAVTLLTSAEDDSELSTSDYASAERVDGRRGSDRAGFSNPHYLGPDVRALAALTPDSGASSGDIELQDLRPRARTASPAAQLHLLLVGGKEASHPALLQRPLSLWTYRLL